MMNTQADGTQEFAEATIATLQQQMRAGERSCTTLIQHCLARIARWDERGPQLSALLAINPQALALAAQRDAALSADGRLAGPLHGIPVVLKDNCNTRGMPTTAGSRSLAGFVPARDSTVARKLAEAGAVLLAKANLHEFALGGTSVSSLGGQTRNPYDLTRTPGGSSGGSAVAVAMDYCTVAIGTDTVNSVRSPASANCVVGLRPTQGLISRAGFIPVAGTQDVVGPMARSVADVARVLDVLAGYDPDDPVTARCIGRLAQSYLGALDRGALHGRRLGLLRNFLGQESRHAAVNQAMDQAVALMQRAGAEVVAVAAPDLDADRLIQQFDVQKWEFKAALNQYLQAEPAAPVHSLADIIASGQFHHASLQDFLSQAEAVTDKDHDVDYLRRRVALEGLRDRLFGIMAAQDLDALIYPLQKCLVVPIGQAAQAERNGILAALTGFPALNVPAGFSSPSAQAPLGLPVGIDFLARPFDEPLLLGLGHAFEQSSRFRRPPVQAHWPGAAGSGEP